jgi:hypothetical protein
MPLDSSDCYNAARRAQVRVTNPKSYLVKPAQGLVDAGGKAKVTFIFQQLACDEVCEQLASGKEAKPDKVLIQSIKVTQTQYDEIVLKKGKVRTCVRWRNHSSWPLTLA